MKKESLNGEIEKLKQVSTVELIESVRKIHALNSSGEAWLVLELCRRLEALTPPAPKTVMDWLLQAKADGLEWADSAIAQADNDKDDEVEGLHEAVGKFAFWDRTKEGYGYWFGISEGLK